MHAIFKKQRKYIPGTIGFYGKLPKYGDFISLSIENDFVSIWDIWWQNILFERQNIEEDDINYFDDTTWRNCFLNSPAWHFLLLMNKKAWTGVFFPSHDSFERLFPWTIVVNVTNLIPSKGFFTRMTKKRLSALNWIEQIGIKWHRYIDNKILSPLKSQWQIKDWLSLIEKPEVGIPIKNKFEKTGNYNQLNNDLEYSSFMSTKENYYFLNKKRQYNNINKYAKAWWWQERVDLNNNYDHINLSANSDVILVSDGLPHFYQMSAFFDKKWEQHGWNKL